MFRTAKQKQGDRKRAKKLKGRKKSARKKIIKGVLIGGGTLLGGKIALGYYNKYKDRNAFDEIPIARTVRYDASSDAYRYKTIDI